MDAELVETDDDLLRTPPLSPKEEAFCVAYGDPESATYGKATASAQAAGYVEPRNAAWKLRRRRRIVERLEQFHDAQRAGVQKVLSELEHERRLAEEKGDVASMVRATELKGKHQGMFIDRGMMTVADLTVRETLTESERAAAHELGRLLIERGFKGGTGQELLQSMLPASSTGREDGQKGQESHEELRSATE